MSGILYGNLRIDILHDVGARVERTTLRLPPPRLGLRQALSRVKAPALLLGRAEQLDQVRHAIRDQRPIEFNAPCGSGKSALLRQVAANSTTDDIAGSCVYLQAGDHDVEDLLQRLVDELYTADQPIKPTPEQCTQLLGQVQALILLDDVLLDPGQVEQLVHALPGCILVLGSPRPVLGRHGRSQILAGLPDDAALELVTRDLGRPLGNRELPAAKRLVAAVDGQPLHLRQAAALVREDGLSFATLAKKADHDPEVLDRLSVNALAEQERRALAVLALAAGALLPKELVGVMGDIAQIGECLGLLHRRGLADQQDDRFGLPVCKVESYRQMLLKDLHLAAALRELGSWLATQDPTSEESRSAVGAALAVIGFAAERGDWPAVVRLVRVVEPILTLAGRWEACRHALDLGLQAAKATGDRAAEAFLAHQQGTLALCQDQLDAGKRLLEHALELREQLGDRDGAAVTRHNLQLLQPPEPPPDGDGHPPPPNRIRKRLLTAGAVLAAVFVVVGSYMAIGAGRPKPPLRATPAALSFGRQAVNTASAAQAVTVTNTTEAGVRLASVGIVGANAADFQVTSNACTATLPRGARCAVSLRFVPTIRGNRTAQLSISVAGLRSPLVVPLDGTGVRPPPGLPRLTPAALSFGEQQVGTTSSPRDLTLSNTGTGRLRVAAVNLQGGNRGDFRVTANRCGAPIDPGRSCSIRVRFGPTAPGSRAASLVVRLSDSNAALVVPLGGTGVPRPDLRPPILKTRDLVVEATAKDGAVVSYAVTAVDDVDGRVPVQCQPASATVFPLGTTHVSCTAADHSGNTARGGFAVTVRDSTPPTVTVPGNVTVEAAGPDGAIVEFPHPTASDRVDGPVEAGCKPLSGGTFPLGTTKVTCSAVDSHGNEGAGSFDVNVRDTTPPKIGTRKDIVAWAPYQATSTTVTFDPPPAWDTVDTEVTVTCDPSSGSRFSVGQTTVTCTAIDDSGNRSGQSQFTITVYQTPG